MPVQIKLKRFDTELPLPSRQTAGAVGYDLYCRLDTPIAPGRVGYVPLNVAVEVPSTHWVLIAARSSSHKHGLMLANGIGVGDSDFRGDDDEYTLAAYNFTDQPVTISRGTRIAQMLIMSAEPVELVEVQRLEGSNRGKFGSTGHR